MIYQADREITLCAKDGNGKIENLVTLPARTNFGSVKVTFNLKKGTCTLVGEDGKTHSASLTVKNVMSLG